jgi:hypothetical protein
LLSRADSIIIGSLLRDIGKIIRRGGSSLSDGEAGEEFIKSVPALADSSDILACARYPHRSDFEAAALAPDSPAYIIYTAELISGVGSDNSAAETINSLQPLESIFNKLNDNDDNKIIPPSFIRRDRIIHRLK